MNTDFAVYPREAATHVLTDVSRVTRRDALDGLYQQNNQPKFVSCQADNYDNVSAALADARVVSQVLVNCGTVNASTTYGERVAVGQTNTISITVEAQLKLSDFWTQKLAGTYSRSWTTTRTTSYSTTLTMPPGRYGWITMSSQMINITGDDTLKAGNQIYNVTIAQSATDEWVAKNEKRNDVTTTRDFTAGSRWPLPRSSSPPR